MYNKYIVSYVYIYCDEFFRDGNFRAYARRINNKTAQYIICTNERTAANSIKRRVLVLL